MKQILLLAGASGGLGKAMSGEFISSNFFDEIHLFGNFEETAEGNLFYHKLPKLNSSEETNIFSSLSCDTDAEYYLFSTLGGFTGGKSFRQTSQEEYKEMFEKNFFTALILARSFAEQFKDAAGGSICFTSAYSSFVPEKGRAAYDISKGALNQMIAQLSEELPDAGFTINAIAPLLIDTPANREWISADKLPSLIRPEEIASFAASIFRHYKFINGNVIKMKSRIIKGNNNA